MKKTAMFVALSALISCGGGGGGSSSSSGSSGVIPMISDIKCASGSCVPSSNAKSFAGVIGEAGAYYSEIDSEIIPQIKSTFKEIDSVLKLAGIESCNDIPTSGSQSVTYQGATISITGRAPTMTDFFGSGANATKAIEASVNSNKFFEAEFNCSSPRVGYVKGDLTLLDPNDFEKFMIYFYENGSNKMLNLFTHYMEGSTKAGYMVLFESNGTNFDSYYSYDSDLDGAGSEMTLAANYSSTNGGRVITETNDTNDFAAVDMVTATSGTVNSGAITDNNAHYCLDTSLSVQTCNSNHPGVGQFQTDSIAWGMSNNASITGFQVTNTQGLDFSF